MTLLQRALSLLGRYRGFMAAMNYRDARELRDLEKAAADNVTPGEQWVFDQAVTDAFDDMLKRSIPQYDVMRATVTELAAGFIRPGCLVLDLGCSRGEALSGLLPFGNTSIFRGLEISPPMLNASRERFKGSPNVRILEHDLRKGLPPFGAPICAVLSILTLQFVPVEYRQRLVRQVFDALAPGGAFFLVEKVLGADASMEELFVSTYLGRKATNGYSQEQIERKRLSLEGVLVPMTARGNEDLLRGAGFEQVDCFWRWCNFAGWIGIKG